MKRLTRWMVRRYLPGYFLIERVDTEEYFRHLAGKYLPGHHIARNPAKGADRKKRQTAQKEEINATEES